MNQAELVKRIAEMESQLTAADKAAGENAIYVYKLEAERDKCKADVERLLDRQLTGKTGEA